ncbi:MAG: helix-turn-helix domain-containing protein [Pseudomonadota bacterium]
MDVTIYLSPGFNLTATMHFVDAFQALNALATEQRYTLHFCSDTGGPVASRQGPTINSEDVDLLKSGSEIVLVSTSDDPMEACFAPLAKHLRYWEKQGNLVIGLETGAFAMADAGLLDSDACVAPSHAKAFQKGYPRVALSDALYTTDGNNRSCVGGAAALDMALHLLSEHHAADLVRSVRDYLLAPAQRPGSQGQNAGAAQPLNDGLPAPLKVAIEAMRGSLDQSLSIPDLAKKTKLSQRQLERLFRSHTGRSPNQYYRMLRLDRAREMVTRGSLPMPEVAAACGFQSSVHFSRAYKEQFGRPPMRDRVRTRLN